MVPVRELYECVMKKFKENNWESILLEDFLREARDKLGCDGKDAHWGITWERIMAQGNGRHAAIILDCLTSASRFGQHEQEPHLAWRARDEGGPTAWAAYVAEKIRQTGESSSGASREDDARDGDEVWEQAEEEVVSGGAEEHDIAPVVIKVDLEAGMVGDLCDDGSTEGQMENVPEEHNDQMLMMPALRLIGFIKTGDLHVYIYDDECVEDHAHTPVYQPDVAPIHPQEMAYCGYGYHEYSGSLEQCDAFIAQTWEYHEQQLGDHHHRYHQAYQWLQPQYVADHGRGFGTLRQPPLQPTPDFMGAAKYSYHHVGYDRGQEMCSHSFQEQNWAGQQPQLYYQDTTSGMHEWEQQQWSQQQEQYVRL